MQPPSRFSRTTFLALFFGLQILGIGVGLFTDAKYFNWVPYDQLVRYEIEVILPSGALSSTAIYQRYGRSAAGRENRNVHNLIAILRRYEITHGQADSARITLNYILNGHDHGEWTWPEPAD